MPPATLSASSLFPRLKNLFSGNFVTDNEIKEVSRQVEQYSVDLEVTWEFEYFCEVTPRAGKLDVCGYRHLGTNTSQFKSELANLCHDATNNAVYRNDFRHGLSTLQERGLTRTEERFEVKHLGWLSVYRDCETCQAKGKVTCSRCNGRCRWLCQSCSGTSTEYVNDVEYYTDSYGHTRSRTIRVGRQCFNCTLGYVDCGGCSGKGTVTCNDCSGKKLFTDIAQVALHATPMSSIKLQDRLGSKALVQHLTERKHTDYPTYMSFVGATLTGTKNQHNQAAITYTFTATVTQINLSIKEQSFAIQAVGYSLLEFITPTPIFDFLFKNIIGDGHKIARGPNKKLVDIDQARQYFNQLQSAPIPALVLSHLGQGHTEEDIATTIRQHDCMGLISQGCASKLIEIAQKSLNVLSPRYSESVWSWAMLLPSLLIFTATLEFFTDIDISARQLSGGVILVSVIAIVLTLLAGFIAYPLSALACHRLRKKIPEKFHRRQAFKEPLRFHSKKNFAVLIYGLITGVTFYYFGIKAPIGTLISYFT